MDSTVLTHARARSPWCAPRGCVLLRIEGALYPLKPRDGRIKALAATLRGTDARS